MRTRKQIETDGKRVELLALEVLLDIREQLKTRKGKKKTLAASKKTAPK